jgi:chromosome segregation ATPase
MDIFTKLANFKTRNDALESLNEQNETYIARLNSTIEHASIRLAGKQAEIQKLNDECEMHAETNVKLRDRIKFEQEMAEYDSRTIRDYFRKVQGMQREINGKDAVISRRGRIIDLLRNRIRRLEIQLRIRQDVADQWEQIAQHYKCERNEYQGIARSYGRTISEQDQTIQNLRDELAALKNAGPEIEPEMTEVICGPEIIIDFNARPDIIGYAPCGNGCPVKRGIDGRMYDDHEISCEDSPEYSGIDL